MEIKDLILLETDVKEDDFLLKNFYYNVTNKEVRGNRFTTCPRLFEYIKGKVYRLGESYSYNGKISYARDNQYIDNRKNFK